MKKFLILIIGVFLLNAFYVRKDEKIEEDINVIGETLIIEGEVKGDVAVINGDLELYGRIDGNVAVIGGNANLYSGSYIKGSLAVVGGKINREKDVEIEGEISQIYLGPLNIFFKLIPHKGKVPAKTEIKEEKIKIKEGKKYIMPILIFIWGTSLSLIILLISLIVPQGIENMEMFIEKRMGMCFLTGFLVEILFFPTLIFLIISIIGILLIPLFIIAFVLALLISLAPSSLFIGKLIKKNAHFLPSQTYFLSFIGCIILFIILILGNLLKIGNTILGVFGFVITLIILFILYLYFTFGLGSIILSRLGTRKL